jgi:NADH dehydrogenase
MWLGVHIYNLIGFRNRLVVMLNWAFDYFLRERAIRLILPNEPGHLSGHAARPATARVPVPEHNYYDSF